MTARSTGKLFPLASQMLREMSDTRKFRAMIERIDDSRHRELGDYRAFKAKKRQKQQPDQIQCDIEHVLRVNDHAGNENAGYKNENIIETPLF
ncbi:hypothetical protein LC724_24750 [Blautia sp. RD014234]|nr:hypothetical protein [Blautia parvula]